MRACASMGLGSATCLCAKTSAVCWGLCSTPACWMQRWPRMRRGIRRQRHVCVEGRAWPGCGRRCCNLRVTTLCTARIGAVEPRCGCSRLRMTSGWIFRRMWLRRHGWRAQPMPRARARHACSPPPTSCWWIWIRAALRTRRPQMRWWRRAPKASTWFAFRRWCSHAWRSDTVRSRGRRKSTRQRLTPLLIWWTSCFLLPTRAHWPRRSKGGAAQWRKRWRRRWTSKGHCSLRRHLRNWRHWRLPQLVLVRRTPCWPAQRGASTIAQLCRLRCSAEAA
mmetsp:Transcript_28131/g.90879  ORF Transcript_28131/g.90879 Transcript_28131/m.90879 type:complete len:278 (-) Transcript_28131:1140-1973(-)